MDIIRGNLAVSGRHNIGARENFGTHGFQAQLQCAEAFDDWLPQYVEVKSLPFYDKSPIPESIFTEAQEWLGEHWDSGDKILISCAVGRSRSVTMAIGLLNAKGGLSFMDSAKEVLDRVVGAYPHPYVLASASVYCGEPLTLRDLRVVYSAVQQQRPFPWPDDLLREAAELSRSRHLSSPRVRQRHDGCDLCNLSIKSQVHDDSDSQYIIVDCILCKVPMIVWREHTLHVGPSEAQKMSHALRLVGDSVFGSGNYNIDKNQRKIPNHLHWHCRKK